MKLLFILLSIVTIINSGYMSEKSLTNEERAVVWGKATERPFSGKYNDFFKDGVYVCKVCGAPLYKSSDKFKSGCGWPAFDDAFPRAIKRVPDADGRRTEIVCARCGAHLGHVFEGEGLTPKNVRHCVNSLSMDFIPAEHLETAYVAGGCFWGVEELMRHTVGVVSCVSGYCGGGKSNPTYREVCGGKTGHLECVEVIFDKTKISYSDILKRFFEIHDFTQHNGQGPDIGEQYKSAIFYRSEAQKNAADRLVLTLKQRGYDIVTRVLKFKKFWNAEDFHQRYYENTGKRPYCHMYRKIFD